MHEFPDDVLTRDGNFVNDIVIDPDGGYAYMSDVGTGPDLRPGGIVGLYGIPVFLNWTTLTKEIVDISAAQWSAQTFIHNAIMFIDTSNNAWHNQAHWLTGTPYLSTVSSNDIKYLYLTNLNIERLGDTLGEIVTFLFTKLCQMHRQNMTS